MKTTNLEILLSFAKSGSKEDVKSILSYLNSNTTLQETREIDFALSQVETLEGIEEIKDQLFIGTQMQRNYCALCLSRIQEHFIVRKALDEGLIDEYQVR